ncbi:MAG TPA: response regulator, partial [Geobacteraceae bacterium]
MKPTILLVADDDCLCEALAASLKSEGCEAVAAGDLTSALSLYETFRPELVILDGDLPDTDGSDAFRQFRLRHKADHTPILMILDSPSAYTRAMEAEATDVVFRHLDLQLICFRVRCLLQLNRTIRQTRASEARLAATLRLAQLASWKWTPMDGGFALSEHAARVFRMDTIPKAFSYHDFLAAIYAPDRTLVDSALKMAVQKQKKVSVEFRIKRPNGTLGHVMLQGEPDLDATTATFPALHGILHDATERKHSEAGHQLLKDAIDALPVGITVTD